MEFFRNNPNRNVAHPEVVDWAVPEWLKRTGKVFRDPDRGIRSLHAEGKLKKMGKGVYRYEPNALRIKILSNFSTQQKQRIFKRDQYKCVICGKGREDGVELHVDHIKPQSLGGEAIIKNGQTLCATHNFRKKNLGQTETGKKMFIRLYELSKKKGDEELKDFCANILKVYEEHGINSHIKWKIDDFNDTK